MVNALKSETWLCFKVVVCVTVLVLTIDLYTSSHQTVYDRFKTMSALNWMYGPSYPKPTYHVIPVQVLSIEKKAYKSIAFYRNVSLEDEAKFIVKTCTEYNWRDVLKPCESKLAYEKKEMDRKKQTNVLFSKIEVEVRPVGYASTIKIYTKDDLGRKKNYGGDSWVIKVEGKNYRQWFHPKDNLDGTYEGMFVTHQIGAFSLVVTLDFSLCDGLLNPPVDFFRKGLAEPAIALRENGRLHYMTKDFLHISSEKLQFNVIESDQKPKLIETFDLGGLPHNQCGYWANGSFHTYSNTRTSKHLNLKSINRSVFDRQNTLLLGGDSVNRYLYDNIKQYGICEKVFNECKNFYSWMYKRIDNKLQKGEGHDLDIKEYIKYQIEDRFNTTANKTYCKWCSRKSFYVVNFGLHTTMRTSFTELKATFQLFLQTLKEQKRKIGEKNFPTVIWKTTSPVRFEAINPFYNIRFMSRPRVYLWNLYTTSEARKAGLPVSDGYNMALSSINGHIDQCHHKQFVFTRSIEQLIEMVLKKSENAKAYKQII